MNLTMIAPHLKYALVFLAASLSSNARSIHSANLSDYREIHPIASHQQIPISKNKPTASKAKNKVYNIDVSGISLDDLRNNLKTRSNVLMKNKSLTPQFAEIDINSLKIHCALSVKKSNFTKLVLVYGDINSVTNSCESCENVLFKNPGSKVIGTYVNKIDNMIYKVIAISE